MSSDAGPEPGTLRGLELRPNVLRMLERGTAIPGLSARKAVLVLAGCFILAAILFPVALHQPRWIEFEMVIGAWWLIWVVALTSLLYSGRPLVHDFNRQQLPSFRRSPASGAAKASRTRGSWTDGVSFGDFSLPAGGDGEGCVAILLAVLAAIVALLVIAALVFVAVEFVVPAIALGAYALIRGQLLLVQRNRGAAAGNLMASAIRGVTWATLFMAPLALAVWLGHILLSPGA